MISYYLEGALHPRIQQILYSSLIQKLNTVSWSTNVSEWLGFGLH